MEEFYSRYLRVCKECLVSPMECVISQLDQRPDNAIMEPEQRVLDLSSYNFTPEDCNAIAKVFSFDNYFKEVSFNDCLLSEDASKILLYGLAHSRALEKIDLKGNNLRSSGADVVGIFLRKNTSVRYLRLDWNSLGLWGTGMRALADGLAINQTVVMLDLRNNQISHEGASELANCMKRNKTLKALDLRWNNIGLLGGRAFLNALQHNRCLTSLELQGNNIPEDILKAIGVAIKLNNDREVARHLENARTEKIMKKMERIELEKTLQVSMLQEKLEEQAYANDEFTKSSYNKIGQLREALEKNKVCFDEMSKELLATKNELKTTEEKNVAFDGLVSNLKYELNTDKENNKSLESRLHVCEEDKSSFELKVAEMEKMEPELKNVINSLEEEIDRIKNDHKIKLKQLEVKREETMSHTEEEHRTELNNLHANYKEKESMLKHKIENLETEKISLEEKASQLRSEIVAVKLKAEEEAVNVKSQLRREQVSNSKQYEERVEALQASRDEQHGQVTKYLSQVTELQMQLNLKTKECDQNKEERESLTQQLLRKEAENKTELSRLRMENESEKRTQDELRDKTSSLEATIKENTRKKKELISAKDREIESLEERVQAKEVELKRQREEEVRRAELLESAIFTYVSSTKAARPPSPFKQ